MSGCPVQHLPQVFVHHCGIIVGITNNEQLCLLFQGPGSLGQILPIPLGMPWHMSTPRAVPHNPHDPVRASFPYSPECMGWPWKFCNDVIFLLVLPKEGAAGKRVYGLDMVWVHPYQARVSIIEDTAKQLALLASTGPDWPYALVQLNGDVCHVLLPTESHPSVMMEGNTSNVPYRKIHWLEVHPLLGSGSQVVYP